MSSTTISPSGVCWGSYDPDMEAAPTRAGMPDTSFEAAGRVDVSRMQRLTLAALQYCAVATGMPVEAWRVQQEAERRVRRGVSGSTIRTRLNELTRKGQVEVADRGGTTRSGHRCARYQLTGKEPIR